MKELDRLLSFGLGFTVFFVLWGFIFSNTIIASYIVNDICYATLLFLFSVLIVRYSSIEISVLAAIWCPYLLYTIFRFIVRRKLYIGHIVDCFIGIGLYRLPFRSYQCFSC